MEVRALWDKEGRIYLCKDDLLLWLDEISVLANLREAQREVIVALMEDLRASTAEKE